MSWHAPSQVYPVCPSLEAEPWEAAKGTPRGTGWRRLKQECRITVKAAEPGKTALQTPDLDLLRGEALWMAGGQGRIWRGRWRGRGSTPKLRSRNLGVQLVPKRCTCSSQGPIKDGEGRGCGEKTQRLNTATGKTEGNLSENQPGSFKDN